MTDHHESLAGGTLAGPELKPVDAATKAAREQPVQVQRRSMRELKSILSILVIVVFVITFVVQAFRVPTGSMENTLMAGDFLLADKLHLAEGGVWRHILPYCDIQRGDVVVFRYPVEPETYFVKRVIGVPGDRIRLVNKVVFVNGSPLEESYAIHQRRDHNSYRDDFPSPGNTSSDVNERWRMELQQYLSGTELAVPPGRYFVMGDNRDDSSDSRYWGFVPRGNIMGRPLVIYLSVRGLKGNEDGPDGKLYPSGQLLVHFLQLARWKRMFHLVR